MVHNKGSTMRSRAASTLAVLLFTSSSSCITSCTGKSNKVPSSAASSPVGFRQACFSTAFYRKTRWFVGGLAPEILTNVVGAITPASSFFAGRKKEGIDTTSSIIENRHKHGSNNDEQEAPIAVVTGATGGIGTEICRGLIQKGYHVIVAARNSQKGRALVEKLQQEVSEASVATYIPLQAGCPKSALHFASALGEKSCAVLINNAAVMQHVTKSQTIKTNLIGPSILTMALLPALRRYYDNNNPNNNGGGGDKQDATTHRRRFPVVVNVGSSSHLRADRVDPVLLERNDDNNDFDMDLTAYGQSKLGLMQFSTLLRNNHSISSWLSVIDAHPGIVWTPMLQGAWGPKLAKMLEDTGVYRIFFKTPEDGAATIIAAAEQQPQHHHQRQQQTYFVNCSPGGYASPESRDVVAANEIWRNIIQATAEKVNPNQCIELSTHTVHDDKQEN